MVLLCVMVQDCFGVHTHARSTGNYVEQCQVSNLHDLFSAMYDMKEGTNLRARLMYQEQLFCEGSCPKSSTEKAVVCREEVSRSLSLCL